MAGLRSRVVVSAALGLVGVVLGIARLALLGWLLARVFAGAGLSALVLPIAAVVTVIAARSLVEYARTMLAHHTAFRVQARLRQRLYDHLVRLGPAYLTHERTGPVATSMVEGVQQLEVYLRQFWPHLVVTVATPILIFTFVAFVELPVAVVLVGAALVTLIAPALWHRRDRAASYARSRAYAAFGAELLDALQGLATLKAFGQSGERARLLEKKSHDLFQSTMWLLGANTMGRGITDAGMAIGAVAALTLGAWRVSTGAMDLASLLVILMLGVEVFRPLRELRMLLHAGMLGTAAARGILDILGARPVVTERAPAAEEATLPPTVTFEGVKFAYPGARRIVHDGVAFHVGAGERVAFVGPSGSGKSTLVRLLLRFYDPDGGCVRLGGRDIRELPLHELRRRIAVVSQDTYLFHGTVEENLRMGKADATPAELEAAARAADAHEFITTLPQGYGTVVGERGIRLSGGQRQRIAIARALLRDAPILVLDEALSSVDAESEALIQRALDRLMEGRTTLIFAHRLSSVIGADRIMVLDGGRLAESGTHAELMARGGPYWRLMSPQVSAARSEQLIAIDGTSSAASAAEGERAGAAVAEDGAVRSKTMGWPQALPILIRMIRGYRARLVATFGLGIARVASIIAVGVLSALVVRAVKHDAPFGALLVALAVAAPLAGLLHWLQSWLAPDIAYRLLNDIRPPPFRKLDALAPPDLPPRRRRGLR